MPKIPFVLLLALAGCETYGGSNGGYGYGGPPAYGYSDYGPRGYDSGYESGRYNRHERYDQHERYNQRERYDQRDRNDRRERYDQPAQMQQPRQSAPPPPPPSATQNQRALKNLGFRPN